MSIVNLVVVAHPDDEILGFGGAGSLLVQKGEIVQPIILCGNVDERTLRPSDEELYQDMVAANNEVGFSSPVLGNFPNIKMNNVDHKAIVQFIEKQVLHFGCTRLFTHHPGDLNDDHSQISKACMVAARLPQRNSNVKPLDSVHFMEVLSATDWMYPSAGNQFVPNSYEDITSSIDLKISALKKYRNVMRPAPHPRSDEVIRGLSSYRGGQCGCRYAEAFQTIFKRGF